MLGGNALQSLVIRNWNDFCRQTLHYRYVGLSVYEQTTKLGDDVIIYILHLCEVPIMN